MNLSQRLAAARGEVAEPIPVVAVPEPRPATPEPAVVVTTQAGSDALRALKERASQSLFERLGPKLSDPDISDEQLHALVRGELQKVVADEQAPLTREERQRLIAEVGDDVLGLGPLQRLLDDPSITEIMVNGADMVYVEQAGKLTRTGTRFTSEQHLRQVIERIVGKVGRRIDESSPMVDARLADGSRVNAVIPPLAFGGSSLTVRKFSRQPWSVDDLVRFGTLGPDMADLLREIGRAHV